MNIIKSKIIDMLVISVIMFAALILFGFTQRVAASELPILSNPVIADKTYKDPALECKPGKNNCNLMKKYVNPIIAFLTAVAGIAITVGIISGGLRYAAAGDDPGKVSAAKKQIGTAILALVCLLLLYAGLRWLIPGL